MTSPRSEQIDLAATPFYHVVSRCVRQSYLCGENKETGQDYSHRKIWLIHRIKSQSEAFAIDIAAYAIMDNHYHLVLHVDAERARSWDESEVIERWAAFYANDAKKIQDLIKIDPDHPDVKRAIIKWRDRLMSLSWYMRTLNEFMARQCNAEDECKGRFWEGRFKSQALLDEGAILSAMVYVDLNPIRAGMFDTPETSEFTSIQERIKTYKESINKPKGEAKPQPNSLMMLQDDAPKASNNELQKLNISILNYIQLVDDTGRIVKNNKKGKICSTLKPILERLGLSEQGWKHIVQGLESKFSYAIGSKENLITFGQGKKTIKGTNYSKQVYSQFVN